ncbi:unnamed protein product [Ilex paraguariensis]|uniref:beta-fructofuranosidase n=1 Tax=Ilex paraguariensis TaxID=185542 RepID=A0ABC8T258_9AQUA
MDTNPASYTPLPEQNESTGFPADYRRPSKGLVGIFLCALFISSLVVLIINQGSEPQSEVNAHQQKSAPSTSVSPGTLKPPSRGESKSVSEETFREISGETEDYPWTNSMLSWQRTSYHFQPEKNWMNGNSQQA